MRKIICSVVAILSPLLLNSLPAQADFCYECQSPQGLSKPRANNPAASVTKIKQTPGHSVENSQSQDRKRRKKSSPTRY